MKKRKINDDEFIININSKYFVVNEYTYDLINNFYNDSNNDKFKKKYHFTNRKVNAEYKKLKKSIDNVDYYDDNINLEFPLKIQWRITNKCNLHCKHCYLGKLSQKQLSNQELMVICEKLINSNVMEVTITGGEALLVPSLHLIVAKLIANDIRVNIYTNALLLDSFINKINKELGYDPIHMLKLFISVDGTEKVHDDIRGKGNFSKTINNMKIAIDRGYKIITNTVLSKINYMIVPELYIYLSKLGIYKIQISNIIPMGSADDKMVLSKEEKQELICNLKNILKKNNMDNRLLYAEMPDENDNSKVYVVSKNGKEYLQPEKWKCSAGIGKATINYDGTIYCCPFIKNFSLGNILKQEFNEIWSSDERYNFLKFIMKNNNGRVCIAVKQRNDKGGD